MQDAASASIRLFLRPRLLFGFFATLNRLIFGQRIGAVVGLTWKAAFRFRLFVVIAVLLLGSVVGLPLLIEDDGTARGFTQILLTYTLGTISALLGLSTLWLACGILARDIEDCQMQVLAVKPIARWQIWLGKWLGLLTLDAAMLLLCGACVYGLLQWRATRLPAAEQKILHEEVLVARGSAKEKSRDQEIEANADQILKERLQKDPVTQADLPLVRQQILEQVKAEYQIVPPNYTRLWEVDLGSSAASLRGQPLRLRIKFNAADKSPSGTFQGVWFIGAPNESNPPRALPAMSMAPDTFHEFEIPPNMVDEKGHLTVMFTNPNATALLFPLDEGFEVLYREGSFMLNFLRGLAIIFCWMAVLAALGMAAASFLSFPVAAFLSLGVLTMVLCSGTISGAISDNSIMGYNSETGAQGFSPLDFVVLPAFGVALHVINLVKGFSPIDSLSSGRTISWLQLGQAFAQIVLLIGGLLALFGIFAFHRRELATAQGNQ
jgi:hypothetical protein